ncbi:MAG: 6,7-dimethyl-8-ribityllumazine synthase [Roseovarius sp.]|nr:6,7-dimethyl-8-ribityllumazine synthase [Roseovarius sp.]
MAGRMRDFDGYVALGCVIRGETTHYETVCNDSSRGLMLLGLQGLCIGNGILTVENRAQAEVRADASGQNKGGGAAAAALHLVALARKWGAARTGVGSRPGPAGCRRQSKGTPPHDQRQTDRPQELSGNLRRRMKSAARLYAVQALFQMEHSQQGSRGGARRIPGLPLRRGSHDGAELLDGDVDLFVHILDDAVNSQSRIDRMTDRALVRQWPIDRIDPTLRRCFAPRGAELRLPDTPPRVVISEDIAIARASFPEGKEGDFVNAILDHMAATRRNRRAS